MPLQFATRVVLLTLCGCRKIINYNFDQYLDEINIMIMPPINRACMFSLEIVSVEDCQVISRRFRFQGKYDEETSLPIFKEDI